MGLAKLLDYEGAGFTREQAVFLADLVDRGKFTRSDFEALMADPPKTTADTQSALHHQERADLKVALREELEAYKISMLNWVLGMLAGHAIVTVIVITLVVMALQP